MRISRLILSTLVLLAGSAYAQARISDGSEPKDPIDVAFDKCESNWEGERLSDWDACISKANSQWRRVMESTYRDLKAKLAPRERDLLIKSQTAWIRADAANRAFVDSHGDLKNFYGAEGEISYHRDLMFKTRTRALELREYLDVFVDR